MGTIGKLMILWEKIRRKARIRPTQKLSQSQQSIAGHGIIRA